MGIGCFVWGFWEDDFVCVVICGVWVCGGDFMMGVGFGVLGLGFRLCECVEFREREENLSG